MSCLKITHMENIFFKDYEAETDAQDQLYITS